MNFEQSYTKVMHSLTFCILELIDFVTDPIHQSTAAPPITVTNQQRSEMFTVDTHSALIGSSATIGVGVLVLILVLCICFVWRKNR